MRTLALFWDRKIRKNKKKDLNKNEQDERCKQNFVYGFVCLFISQRSQRCIRVNAMAVPPHRVFTQIRMLCKLKCASLMESQQCCCRFLESFTPHPKVASVYTVCDEINVVWFWAPKNHHDHGSDPLITVFHIFFKFWGTTGKWFLSRNHAFHYAKKPWVVEFLITIRRGSGLLVQDHVK